MQPTSVPCKCLAQRRFECSLHNSGISADLLERCTMESFKPLDENARRMKETALAFLADKQALCFGCFGRSGNGKTHISIALCVELAKSGLDVKYMQYNTIMRQLIACKYDRDGYAELFDVYANCGVLCIDDLFNGAADARTGRFDAAEKRIMFELIDRRYKNKAITVISAECSLNEIKEQKESIATRIYEMAENGKYLCRCNGINRRVAKV